MIDKIAYELVKDLAGNVSFIDKWAGLVRPLRKKVQNSDKVFPVAINTPSNCEQSDYTALVPDSTKRSIVYIEQLTPPVVDILRHNSKQMSATLRLVVWYNLDLITAGEYVSEDILVDQVLDWLPKRLTDSLFNGAKQVHFLPTGVIYGTELVSQYTYNEIKYQFGTHPYGMFGIDLDVWYIATHCQFPVGIDTGCITGKGNHEDYPLPEPDPDIVVPPDPDIPPDPDPQIADYYIDLDASSNGDGSFESPFNTFTGITFLSYKTYGLKRGSSETSSNPIDWTNLTETVLMPYGTGDNAVFNFTGTGNYAVRMQNCTSCHIYNLDITSPGTNSLVAGLALGSGTNFSGGTGNLIAYCNIYNIYQGAVDGGMGIRGGGTDTNISYCEIYDCGCDGIYLEDCPGLVIDTCNIHDVNQNYGNVNNLGMGASGDCIQLGGDYDNFYIGNCLFDRSDANTGNKYCVIFSSSTVGAELYNGIIEHCTFKTNANVAAGLEHVNGTGVIIRYNKFEGITQGIRIEGISAISTVIHHNLFYDCQRGIGIGSVNGFSTGTKIYNNVFYNVSLYHVWRDNTSTSFDAKNNIHLRQADNGIAYYGYGNTNDVNLTIDHNCFGDAATEGAYGAGTNAIIADPAFIDPTLNNFYLGIGSQCIDAGIQTGYLTEDFAGSEIPTLNIGAYFELGTPI